MKKALLKDTLRQLLKTKNRFLSIFLIVALGAGFFAGVKVTGNDMKLNAAQYYQDQNLADGRVLCTYGIDQQDLEDIQAIDQVKDVQGGYYKDVYVLCGTKNTVVKVMNTPEDEDSLNQPVLIKGRMPQQQNECVIQQNGTLAEHYQIGDTIQLVMPEGENLEDTFAVGEFTIVGYVNDPRYIATDYGTSTIGSGTVEDICLVMESAFDMQVYTEAYIQLENPDGYTPYSDEYQQYVSGVMEQVELVCDESAQRKQQDILDSATKEINQAEATLNQKEEEGRAQLNSAKAQLNSSKTQLDTAYTQLQQLQTAIQQYKDQLTSAQQVVDNGIATANEALQNYTDQYNQLKAAADADPDFAALPETQEQLAQLQAAVQQAQQAVQQAQSSGQEQLAQLNAAIANMEEQYNSGLTQYRQGISQYNSGLVEYNSNLADFEREISTAREEIEKNRSKLQQITLPTYYVYDRDGFPNHTEYYENAQRIDKIAAVFPVFFFLVAALVCLTTMTRMVEEERVQIGTLKALGYSAPQIASKYLIYAATAALFGSIFGMLLCMKVLPWVIYTAYCSMYKLPANPVLPYWPTYIVVISIVAVIGVCGAVIAACLNELREQPSQLMRPKAPKMGKRVLLERVGFIWNRLSFTYKVTARNLFRYKKRIIMTVLGIAGCTALLLTGFGIKDSISDITKVQFDELTNYDALCVYEDGALQNTDINAAAALQQAPGMEEYMQVRQKSVDVKGDSGTVTAYMVVPEKNSISSYLTLRTYPFHQKLTLDSDTAIITEKMADLLGVKEGDTITFADGNTRVTLTVGGICENYVKHYVYISSDCYRTYFDQEPQYNTVYAKLDEGSSEEFSEYMLQQDGVLTISQVTSNVSMMDRVLGVLNYVVVVLIVSAGALAFVVLYNLTNINVNERIREIATIKVLGFFDIEVDAYVSRENMILTFIGMLAGLVMGIALHRFVITVAQLDDFIFCREIHPLSFLIAAAITMLFAMLVNFALHFRLKKIDLAQSMKSVE